MKNRRKFRQTTKLINKRILYLPIWGGITDKIPVVILCGGKGLRLREETEHKPKALVEIGGLPVIFHVMSHYAKYGYTDFILALGYKGEMIKEYFLNFKELCGDFTLNLNTQKKKHHSNTPAWNITFVDTGIDTPTGGRIKAIEPYVETSYFLANYCDGLSDVDIAKSVEHHLKKKRLATLTAVHPMSPFGVLEVNDGLIRSFKEKPRLSGGLINGGFFVFDEGIFDWLKETSILEEEVFRDMVDSELVAAYVHNGYWECMDTFKQVEALNKEYAKSMTERGKAPWQ